MTDKENSPQARKARGQRLKLLRKKSGLTSTDLAKKSGLCRGSISYWENGARGGLTRDGAEKMISTFLSLGLQCDIGWLWAGVGNDPRFIPTSEIQTSLAHPQSSIHQMISSIEKEMDLFLSLNNNAVIAKIEDDLMIPMFSRGDLVGGIWQASDLLSDQKNCILAIENNLAIRNIKKTDNTFEISHINKNIDDSLEIENIDFSKFAEIIRVWRWVAVK